MLSSSIGRTTSCCVMKTLFTIPTYVSNKLKRSQWNFLLEGLEDEFELHLAECNTVCSIIYWVWVTILGAFNEALLGKRL